MGVEDLTFSDRKNSYEGNEDDQSEIKDGKEMESTSSPVIEDFYKGSKTSPRGKGKSTIFFRGWKSIGKKLGFKKTDKVIDSASITVDESYIQDIDSQVGKEVKGVHNKELGKKVTLTKEVNSVKDEEDVFEEEPVKGTTPKVVKERSIDSTISQDGKEKKEIAKTLGVTKEIESVTDKVKEFEKDPAEETVPKGTNAQAKSMPEIKDKTEVREESNQKVNEENMKTAEKDNDGINTKPDTEENKVAEDAEIGETVTKESQCEIEKDELKDIKEQVGEKEAETTMLMSLVDNINSTRSYLESDESQNSYDDPKKSTTQESFFELIHLLEDKKSTKSDSREKTQTFSTWAAKGDKKGKSQISTVNDILKKTERVTSSKSKIEDKTKEKSSKNGHYRDQVDRKLIKKFEEMNVKNGDQKNNGKTFKESKAESSANIVQLTDAISSLRLLSKENADKKKTRDKKHDRYLERGPDKGKVERRQQATASVAPYTSRPTVSVRIEIFILFIIRSSCLLASQDDSLSI